MDVSPFKLDIDELINEFSESNSTTLADMKRIWLSRKFSFIYEARPTTNIAFFMQSLFAHSTSHMLSGGSLPQRLGGFYCLYCLYETQPFKPPFKIYLSLGELKRFKSLVVDAKKENITVVPALVKRMLERHMFLFGLVEINDHSVTERVNEIMKLQNARIKVAYEKLLAENPVKSFLDMDLGMELDLESMKKISTEYAAAKEQAINEGGKVVDIESVKHIAKNKSSAVDVVDKIVGDWNNQKERFNQQARIEEEEDELARELEAYAWGSTC